MTGGSRLKFSPTRIERPTFADLPSVEDLVRLAERTDWLLIQVPATATVGEDGKRSDDTRKDRERYIRELIALLPAHKVWDGLFLPTEGKARFCIRRVVTDQALEDHLDLLTAAATEYQTLANALLRRLANQLDIDVSAFAAGDSWHRHKQTGRLQPPEEDVESDGQWVYFFHGQDCSFTNLATKVTVEARLGYGPECGEDFGVFDPGFFMAFVESTTPHRSDYLPIADLLRDWSENARLALLFMESRGTLRHVSHGWVLATPR